MKRIATLIILMAMIPPVSLDAQHRQQVTRDEAISAALTMLTGSNVLTRNDIQVSEKRDSAGNVLLYEFTMDSVSLILSGSKSCYPILAQCHVSNGPLLNRYNDIPYGLQIFMNEYISQIETCFNNDTIRLYYQNAWDSLISGDILMRRSRVSIGPLTKSRWDQKGCNNENYTAVGYEYHTPPVQGQCVHALVGCVAVAMGQLMYYWKHPVSIGWNLRFDWCNMSDELYDTSSTFLNNRDAIAYLLHDCGTEIDMEYGCDGSGAPFENIKSVLENSYNYSSDAEYVERYGMSNEDWASLLKENLDHGWPVLYEAYDAYGRHTFICDGYGDNNWFSFNMGAGNDSYACCYIGNLNPPFHGVQHNYASGHRILSHIHPAYRLELCNRDVQLEEYYIMCEPFIQQGLLNPWEIIPVTVTKLTSASESSPSLWRTIPSGYSSKYQAQRSVTLKHGFTVERGADFVARIEPCAYCENNNREETMAENPMANAPTIITDEEYSYPTISASFDAGIDTLSVYSSKEFFTLTPNPTDGKVSVEVKSEKLKDKSGLATISICDATGRKVLKLKFSTPTTILDLSELPAGTYFVTVTIDSQSGTRKLVVK